MHSVDLDMDEIFDDEPAEDADNGIQVLRSTPHQTSSALSINMQDLNDVQLKLP